MHINFPKKEVIQVFVMVVEQDLIGIFAGILTTGAFLPQMVKVFSTRSANDFSYGWLFLTITGLSLWLIYGILLSSLPIAVFNFLTILFLLVIVYFKIYGIKIQIPSKDTV